MNVGDRKSFSVNARSFWNDSGINLAAGATYDFAAQGTWIDLIIPSGPDGYPGLFYQHTLEPSLRFPGAKWFALCGALDRDSQRAFLIGKAGRYTCPTSGRLYCFANDVPSWYWNNFGHVTATERACLERQAGRLTRH